MPPPAGHECVVGQRLACGGLQIAIDARQIAILGAPRSDFQQGRVDELGARGDGSLAVGAVLEREDVAGCGVGPAVAACRLGRVTVSPMFIALTCRYWRIFGRTSAGRGRFVGRFGRARIVLRGVRGADMGAICSCHQLLPRLDALRIGQSSSWWMVSECTPSLTGSTVWYESHMSHPPGICWPAIWPKSSSNALTTHSGGCA